MSQADVVEYLKQHGTGTSRDIAEWSGVLASTVQVSLSKMAKRGELKIVRPSVGRPGGGRSHIVYALKERST